MIARMSVCIQNVFPSCYLQTLTIISLIQIMCISNVVLDAEIKLISRLLWIFKSNNMQSHVIELALTSTGTVEMIAWVM